MPSCWSVGPVYQPGPSVQTISQVDFIHCGSTSKLRSPNLKPRAGAIWASQLPVIKTINLVLYKAFCRTPQNRCFWPLGPKNHRCQPISPISHLNSLPKIFSSTKVHMPLQNFDSKVPKLSGKNVKKNIFFCFQGTSGFWADRGTGKNNPEYP